MNWNIVKYTCSWILPILTYFSLTATGVITFVPIIFAFVLIPFLDHLVGLDPKNLLDAEREKFESTFWFDFILQITVLIHVACCILFLWTIGQAQLSGWELTGRVLSMGLMNGVFGINVAHELGHRTNTYHRFLSKILLSTTLFLHFYVEHNRGHHRNVSTNEDPATARFNENIYAFFIRTIPGSYVSAWQIVAKELQRKKQNFWSLRNEMGVYTLVHLCTLLAIYWWCGGVVVWYFIAASFFGIILLETVNYIEHYGLMRKKVSENRYEDVQAWHSWNSDFIIGRLLLFELTRHSDHHEHPNKPYQLLDSMERSFQMPAGYPAMMLLAFLPSAWFAVMNKRILKPELVNNPK
jgi:alkane 1-monooxygenase